MDSDRKPHSRWYLSQQDESQRSSDRRRSDVAYSEHRQAMEGALIGLDQEWLKHPHGEAQFHRRTTDR